MGWEEDRRRSEARTKPSDELGIRNISYFILTPPSPPPLPPHSTRQLDAQHRHHVALLPPVQLQGQDRRRSPAAQDHPQAQDQHHAHGRRGAEQADGTLLSGGGRDGIPPATPCRLRQGTRPARGAERAGNERMERSARAYGRCGSGSGSWSGSRGRTRRSYCTLGGGKWKLGRRKEERGGVTPIRTI